MAEDTQKSELPGVQGTENAIRGEFTGDVQQAQPQIQEKVDLQEVFARFVSCPWCGRKREDYRKERETAIIVKANKTETLIGPMCCSEICAYHYQKNFYPGTKMDAFIALHPGLSRIVLQFGLLTPDRMYPNNQIGFDCYAENASTFLYNTRFWGKPPPSNITYTKAQLQLRKEPTYVETEEEGDSSGDEREIVRKARCKGKKPVQNCVESQKKIDFFYKK